MPNKLQERYFVTILDDEHIIYVSFIDDDMLDIGVTVLNGKFLPIPAMGTNLASCYVNITMGLHEDLEAHTIM